MFKFFRTYNKIILVIGGVVLMIAFLIPQAVQMFAPNPAKESIGTMHGEKVTRGQAQFAAQELSLLQQLPFGSGLMTDDEIEWLMIQADAEDMGIYASDREVDLALQSVGYDDELVAELAANRRTTVATIKSIVRRWLIAEHYRQTVMGTAYRDPGAGSLSLAVNRLESIFTSLQQIQQFGGNLLPWQRQQFVAMAVREANGTRRLSTPLLTNFIRDNFASVTGRAVLVPPDMDAVAKPDEAKLAEVFEAYKDNLAGEGEPYPFGYKYPDRVKLTYLQVPMADVREQVNVDYLEVLDAYKANPQRFADEAGDAPATPTAAAVASLTEELTDRRAQELAARIVASVQSLLAENQRGQSQVDGYLELDEGFTPLPWSEVIEEVRKQHGVTLVAMGDGDAWVAVSELSGLPGIGFSQFGEGQGVPFAAYVNATRKLAEDPNLVPRSLRTQVGVASKPLGGFDGNRYLFRLNAAELAHAPETLDEVREQVFADAKQIIAYEQLVAEAESWQTMAAAEGLDAVATAAQTQTIDLPPFQKVAGNAGDPPRLPEVGSSRAFVDAAFALVESLGEADASIEDLPIERRLAVTPVPNAEAGPALAVYVLDSFDPLTRSGYEQAVTGGASLTVDAALDDNDVPNPLSAKAMAERVGFDLAAYNDEG
ncbi:MAG: hypothetical protein AAGH99_05070 [Planctomycetota bacterium]